MKKRLVELLLKSDTIHERDLDDDLVDGEVEAIADHLLENGVIMLPCKVGTTLYFLYNSPHADQPDLAPRIYESNKWYFDIDKKGVSIKPRSIHGYNGVYHYYLGKTVFLTREEAKKALIKRSKS